MHTEIKKCRICGNAELISILHLGNQCLTGIFPREADEIITSGPLELVKCTENEGKDSCGLVQLKHSYDLIEMYGENYGYRSGLNMSMVKHLHQKVARIQDLVELNKGDVVIDIGSNDSTLLQGYSIDSLILVGIDPTGKKFKKYYPAHIKLIPDFFSAGIVRNSFGVKKAKIITSIAMFYDLESPMDFMREIHEVLADDGIWVFEQSYMPEMLRVNAYDTVCHEHLEYYGLRQIKWMTDKCGFKIVDVELNSVNGGSFSVTVAKNESCHRQNKEIVERILIEEDKKGLKSLKPYEDFKRRIFRHRDDLNAFVKKLKAEGKTVLGYGASTKGNVLLQFCGLTGEDIPFIAEVNEDKFGCYTPGTLIPIISEIEAREKRPDYLMVLPWHFREGIIEREKRYTEAGGKILFPLPEIEIYP